MSSTSSPKKKPVRTASGYDKLWIERNVYEWAWPATGKATRFTYEYTEGGKAREITLKAANRSEAKREAAKLAGLRASGQKIDTTVSRRVREVWPEFAEHWAAKVAAGQFGRRSWGNYATHYQGYIEPIIGGKRLNEVGKLDIERILLAVRKAGRSASTEHGVKTAASSFFAYCVDRDLCSVNPVRGLPKSMTRPVTNVRAVFCPTPEQTDIVIAHCTPGLKPYVIALADTAARSSEGLALRWQDVDFGRGVISLTAQLSRTGERVKMKTAQSRREVPMTQRVRATLLALKLSSRYSSPDDYVFVTESGKPMSYRNAARSFAGAVRRSGLGEDGTRFSLHSLRHGCLTSLIVSGMDAGVVSGIAGHSGTAMLHKRYSHAFAQLSQGDRLGEMMERALGGQA